MEPGYRGKNPLSSVACVTSFLLDCVSRALCFARTLSATSISGAVFGKLGSRVRCNTGVVPKYQSIEITPSFSTEPNRPRFAWFETKAVQRLKIGMPVVSKVRSPLLNPFEIKRDFGAQIGLLGVCNLIVAEGKRYAKTPLSGQIQITTTCHVFTRIASDMIVLPPFRSLNLRKTGAGAWPARAFLCLLSEKTLLYDKPQQET